MTDPHDAELVWRSPMMQPRPALLEIFAPVMGHPDGGYAIAIPDPDQVEANRQRYRSGYDIETGKLWPAA